MNSARYHRLFTLLLTIASVIFGTLTAAAQQRDYVIVLDDSGSMGNPEMRGCRDCNPGNDPDRLAVFGTRALLAALPDNARAAVFTLGNPGPTASVPGLSYLNPNHRANLEDLLQVPAGVLAQHNQPNTPCAKALSTITEQFSASDDNSTERTAIFLSDGRCSDNIQAALSELKKLKDKNQTFRFYLLCLGGTCSDDLKNLARDTGGASIPVTNAGHLVHAFGQVLAASQNVCPSVISSGGELPFFQGALGTRAILIPAADQNGSLHTNTGSIVQKKEGAHTWGNTTLRYYAGLFTGLSAPVQSPVRGSDTWQMLVFPEYGRLQTKLEVRQGACANDGSPPGREYLPGSVLPVGGDICVRLLLVGENGTPIRKDDLRRAPRASFKSNGEQVTPGSCGTSDVCFHHTISALPEGTYSFSNGEITLGTECMNTHNWPAGMTPVTGEFTADRKDDFSGEARNVSFEVEIEDQDKGGALRPGGTEHLGTLHFSGNFSGKLPGNVPRDNFVRVRIASQEPSADNLHRCVTVKVGDTTVGYDANSTTELPITPGSRQPVRVEATAYCGQKTNSTPQEIILSFELHEPRTTATVKFSYTLDNTAMIVGENNVLQITAGAEHGDLAWGPSRTDTGTVGFTARINRAKAEPSLPNELRLELLSPEDAARRDKPSPKKDVKTELSFNIGNNSGAPVVIRAIADGCCAVGTYKVPIELTEVRANGNTGESITYWVSVQVEKGSWWACWGPRIRCALLILFIVLLLRAIWFFFTKIHLLPTATNPTKGPMIRSIRAPEDDSYDGPHVEREASWRWVPRTRRFQLPFIRRVNAAASAPVHILVRGKDWYETAHINLSGREWNAPKIDASLGSVPTLNAQKSLKDGIYFRAGKGGKSIQYFWKGQGYSVLPSKNEIDKALRELRSYAQSGDSNDLRLMRRNEELTPLSSFNVLFSQRAHEAEPRQLIGFEISS